MSTTSRLARLLLALGAACLLAAWSAPARADNAPADAEAIMKRIVEAVKARSYDDFLVDADDRVKQGITKQMFEGVAGQLAGRLTKGYKTSYLGGLRQKGYATHLWKMEIADGKNDDVLVKISVKDGKVAGVFFQ
jgi:hypothetical protein